MAEKPMSLDALATLEEEAFVEREKQRKTRLDKLCEGKSKKYKRRMERIEHARQEYDMIKVRVLPANEAMRKLLVHPATGMGFHETGSAEWPLDSFTERRLRDGDVTIESVAEHETRIQTRRAAPPRRPPPPTPPAE